MIDHDRNVPAIDTRTRYLFEIKGWNFNNVKGYRLKKREKLRSTIDDLGWAEGKTKMDLFFPQECLLRIISLLECIIAAELAPVANR